MNKKELTEWAKTARHGATVEVHPNTARVLVTRGGWRSVQKGETNPVINTDIRSNHNQNFWMHKTGGGYFVKCVRVGMSIV